MEKEEIKIEISSFIGTNRVNSSFTSNYNITIFASREQIAKELAIFVADIKEKYSKKDAEKPEVEITVEKDEQQEIEILAIGFEDIGETKKKKEEAIKMLQDGVKPKLIHKQTGLPMQWIYQQKYRMGRESTLVPLDTDHEEEPQSIIDLKEHAADHIPEEKSSSAKELEVIDDEWYAEKIRQRWVTEKVSSLDVCKELDISMMKFNKIIMQFNIKRF